MDPQPNNASSGLAVRILSVVGGLLAALCLILFLMLSPIIRSEAALTVIGICAIAAAIVGNRTINQLFLDTSITAFYVAGCLALCFAMSRSHMNVQLICCTFMLIAALTFVCSKGAFFPFLSVLLFNTAFTWAIIEATQKLEVSQVVVGVMGIVFLALNLFEARFVASGLAMKRLFRPLHSGFFLSFICGLVWMSGIGYTFDKSVAILSVLIWIGIVLMLHRVMKAMKVTRRETEVSVYVISLILLVPTIFAPALSGALLLLLICFGYGHRVEVGASLILLIYTIGKYYYDLQLTLLAKSATLFFTGIVLLLIWYFFHKQTRSREPNKEL